jgi:hypothetical protein
MTDFVIYMTTYENTNGAQRMTLQEPLAARIDAIRSSLAQKRERAGRRMGEAQTRISASPDVLPVVPDPLRELLNQVRRAHLNEPPAEVADTAPVDHGLPHRLKGNAPQLN